MPEINIVPTTTQSGMPIPLSVRQRLLAAEQLQQQAASTNSPILHRGTGYAKLAAGLLGGVMEGAETKRFEDQQRAAAQALALPMNGAQPSSGATASSPSATSGALMGSNGQLNPAAVTAAVRQSAIAHGVDPDVAAKVLGVESNNGQAYVGDNGSSFGPLQFHYGNINPAMPNRGMGDDFTAATGLDARDPNTAQQQIDFAMSQVPKTGWAPWATTRDKLGLSNFQGIGAPPAQSAGNAPPNAPAASAANLPAPGATASSSGTLPPGVSFDNPQAMASQMAPISGAIAQNMTPNTDQLSPDLKLGVANGSINPQPSVDTSNVDQVSPDLKLGLANGSISPSNAPSGPPPVQPAAITAAPSDGDSAANVPPGPMDADHLDPDLMLAASKGLLNFPSSADAQNAAPPPQPDLPLNNQAMVAALQAQRSVPIPPAASGSGGSSPPGAALAAALLQSGQMPAPSGGPPSSAPASISPPPGVDQPSLPPDVSPSALAALGPGSAVASLPVQTPPAPMTQPSPASQGMPAPPNIPPSISVGPLASDQPQGNIAPNIPTPPVRPANLGAPQPSPIPPSMTATAPSVIPAPVPPSGSPSPQLLAAALGAPPSAGPAMTGRMNNTAQTPTQFNVAQAGGPSPSALAAALGGSPAPAAAIPAPAPPQGNSGPLAALGAAAPTLGQSAPSGAPSAPVAGSGVSPSGFNPYANVPNSVLQQYNAVVTNPYASPAMVEAAKERIAAYMPRAVPDNSVIYNPANGSFVQPPVPHKFDASRTGIIYDQSTGQRAGAGPDAAPINKVMTPEEVKASGLPAGNYQRNTITNEVSPITTPAGNDADTYAKPLVEGLAKYHQSLSEGVPQAQANVRAYNAMSGALQRIQAAGGTTGFATEELKDLKSAINTGANLVGIAPPNDISNQEELQSFSRTLSGGLAKSIGGSRTTNFDLGLYLEANPGLAMSPLGSQRLIGIGAQIEQRKADIGNAINQATANAGLNGARPNAAANEKIIRDYDADPANHIRDPITGQDLTQNYKLPPPGTTPQGQAPASSSAVAPAAAPAAALPTLGPNDQALYAKLPSGAKYIAPDGSTRVKP